MEVVILTPLHNPHSQAVENNMLVVNQPAASNMFVPYSNSLLPSTKATLNALVLSYSTDQLVNLDL